MARAVTQPFEPYLFDATDDTSKLPERVNLPFNVTYVAPQPVRMGTGTEPWRRVDGDNKPDYLDGMTTGVTILDVSNFGAPSGSADTAALIRGMLGSIATSAYLKFPHGVFHFPVIQNVATSDFDLRGTYDHGRKVQGYIGTPRTYDSFGQVVGETIFVCDENWIANCAGAVGYVTDRVAPALNGTTFSYLSNTPGGNTPTLPPLFITEITFDAYQQKPFTSFTLAAQAPFQRNDAVASPLAFNGVNLVRPQPDSVMQYCRFRGFSSGYTSAPPYEAGSCNTQYSNGFTYRYCEVDGRVAAWIDPARPRQGGGLMQNKEIDIRFEHVYLHHTRRSGNALNTNWDDWTAVYYYENYQQHDIANIDSTDPYPSDVGTLPGGFNNWNVEAVTGRIYIINCFANTEHMHINWVVPYQGSSGTRYRLPDHTVFFVRGFRTTDTKYGGCLRIGMGGKGQSPVWPVNAQLLAVGIDASNLFDVRWNVEDSVRMSGVRASVWTARQASNGDAATYYPKDQYFVVDY